MDHYPCFLFLRIIVIPFLPSYLCETSSDSPDLNKLQVLLSIFCYYLFMLCKHTKVPVSISAPTVQEVHKIVHIDILCPRECPSLQPSMWQHSQYWEEITKTVFCCYYPVVIILCYDLCICVCNLLGSLFHIKQCQIFSR